MNISKKQLFFIIATSVILSASITYAIQPMFMMREHQNPSLRTNIFMEFEFLDGKSYVEIGNVITNIGENLTAFAFAYGASVNITKLCVGNASGTLQTKTVLDAVYNDPTDGEYPTGTLSAIWINAGDTAFNVTFQWTFEETITLDACACYLYNTTYAYSMANFPEGQETFTNHENLTVTYVHTYNCN